MKARKGRASTKRKAGRKGTIRPAAEVLWVEPPEHSGGALAKMVVRPETCGSEQLDYRISVYQPSACVAPHSHTAQEQVYHVLEGEGLLELDGERTVVRRDDIVFIPPGVEHAMFNTGMVDLRFVVATSPPDDA